MILADSLQILENEAVQHAVSNARYCGILIGIGIMAVLMAGLSLVLNMVDKKQRKAEEKVDALTTYIRLIMEKKLGQYDWFLQGMYQRRCPAHQAACSII